MSRFLRALVALVDLSDVCGLAGFGALVYGVSQWSGPAAWVIGGVSLLAVAIGPHVRKVKHGSHS